MLSFLYWSDGGASAAGDPCIWSRRGSIRRRSSLWRRLCCQEELIALTSGHLSSIASVYIAHLSLTGLHLLSPFYGVKPLKPVSLNAEYTLPSNGSKMLLCSYRLRESNSLTCWTRHLRTFKGFAVVSLALLQSPLSMRTKSSCKVSMVQLQFILIFLSASIVADNVFVTLELAPTINWFRGSNRRPNDFKVVKQWTCKRPLRLCLIVVRDGEDCVDRVNTFQCRTWYGYYWSVRWEHRWSRILECVYKYYSSHQHLIFNWDDEEMFPESSTKIRTAANEGHPNGFT